MTNDLALWLLLALTTRSLRAEAATATGPKDDRWLRWSSRPGHSEELGLQQRTSAEALFCRNHGIGQWLSPYWREENDRKPHWRRKKYCKYTGHNHKPAVNLQYCRITEAQLISSPLTDHSTTAQEKQETYPPPPPIVPQSCKEMQRSSEAPEGEAMSRRSKEESDGPRTPWSPTGTPK